MAHSFHAAVRLLIAASYGLPLTSTAQPMRASLLATATATFLAGMRRSRPAIHGERLGSALTRRTRPAPETTRSVRK